MMIRHPFAMKLICTLVSLLGVGGSFANAQLPPPGGSGTGGWQISYDREGTDTYTFPKWDSDLNAYRMVTNTRDWKTNKWTLDGTPSLAAGFPEASWNTPTAYTGTAESTGNVTVKVKWNGSGTAPSYMFIALDSAAKSGERSILAGASCNGSNGQGDLFLYNMPTGESHGVHAKRLKLDSYGEAEYKISLNAKSTKTGTYADLIANTTVEAGLEPKALSLFLETYKRVRYVAGDHETIHREPAWTGDIASEQAELGTGEDFGVTVPVQRIGNWAHPELNFTSSISKGFRVENEAPGNPFSNGTIQSITCGGSYSLEQLVGMRENPDTVVLTSSQSDQGDLVPGPFSSTLTMKVWAQERIIHKFERNHPFEISYLKLVGNTNYQLVDPLDDVTVQVATTQTLEDSWEVSLVGSLTGPIRAVGVKADCGYKIGHKWSLASYGGSTIRINGKPELYKVRFEIKTTPHYMNRDLASYGASGYSGEFSDKIENSSEPLRVGRWDAFPVQND